MERRQLEGRVCTTESFRTFDASGAPQDLDEGDGDGCGGDDPLGGSSANHDEAARVEDGRGQMQWEFYGSAFASGVGGWFSFKADDATDLRDQHTVFQHVAFKPVVSLAKTYVCKMSVHWMETSSTTRTRVRTVGSSGRARNGGWQSWTESRPHFGAFRHRGPWFRRHLPCMVARPALQACASRSQVVERIMRPAPAPASDYVPPYLNGDAIAGDDQAACADVLPRVILGCVVSREQHQSTRDSGNSRLWMRSATIPQELVLVTLTRFTVFAGELVVHRG